MGGKAHRLGNREFARASRCGSDLYFVIKEAGVDVENDAELVRAFDKEIDKNDASPDFRAAALASLIDQREQDLGWD